MLIRTTKWMNLNYIERKKPDKEHILYDYIYINSRRHKLILRVKEQINGCLVVIWDNTDYKAHNKLLRMMDILIVVMVSFTYVKLIKLYKLKYV